MNINQICIIDDDPFLLVLLSDYANQLDIAAYCFESWTNINIAQLKTSDLIILDLSLPEYDGIDILERLVNEKINTPILLCSGHDEKLVETAADLLKNHGLAYAGKLLKPFTFSQFQMQMNLAPIALKTEFVSSPIIEQRQHKTDLSRESLLRSITEGRFKLLYQPQICNLSGKVYGIESLARLISAENKVILPDVFIPLLEKYNLMEDFTLSIIEFGLTQLEEMLFPLGIKVAFNISASLIQEVFLTKLIEISGRHSIRKQDIVLELTETSTLEITQNSKKLLTKLRLQGFNLSLDDFGTGYSTIQEIDTLPFNQIKIDKIFVQSMEGKNSSAAIVASTIELAHKLHCEVVAEGVETQTQAEMIKRLNCTISQGYFYSFPLSVKELSSFINQQKALHLLVVA
jgi:EAL domain-containing protein (putative c-di-GMP-specific phosphodiesterase class I)